jgi:hypothetical protein
MDNSIISGLIDRKKNFVFIGEAGSGKTEVAINFAVQMAKDKSRSVHFFDMDQTKPLFRARDAADSLKESGIIFHSHAQLLDAPVITTAVMEPLMDEEIYVVMDVGGSDLGSHMIGQFSRALNDDNTYVFFLINPYRPWSRNLRNIEETIQRVTSRSRIKEVHLVSNPNLGPDTTAEIVISGNEKLHELLGMKSDFICVLEDLVPEVEGKVPESILPVHIYILYPWQEKYDIIDKQQ